MSERFDAWWLPEECRADHLTALRVGELECRHPVPTTALVGCAARALERRRGALEERPVEDIVEAVDAAAGRLADPEDPIRRRTESLLTAATGYSPAMARLVLDRMVADWRTEPLRRLLTTELGDPAVLDRFVAVDGSRRIRAYGPDLSFHVFAGNVPGVAVTSIIRALLVKAPVLGKLASDQPVLPVQFLRALDSVDPDLAAAVATAYWPGGDEEVERHAADHADLVVVYGGDETVAAYSDRVAPERLVVHGPRFSAGLIGREAGRSGDELAARVARAVAVFDQHGCVSPHALWVEDPDGDATDPFVERLAEALRTVEGALPRGRISEAERSAIQQERGAAELRAHDGTTRVLAPEGTEWTVVIDRDPAFRPSCLNRFLHVHPVETLDTAIAALARVGAHLQSVAVAVEPDRLPGLAHSLAGAGASRVTSYERLPWPPAEWHHDGRGPLRELLRWVDLET